MQWTQIRPYGKVSYGYITFNEVNNYRNKLSLHMNTISISLSELDYSYIHQCSVILEDMLLS